MALTLEKVQAKLAEAEACWSAIMNGAQEYRIGSRWYTLSGSDLWTDSGSDPLNDLREWQLLITQDSGLAPRNKKINNPMHGTHGCRHLGIRLRFLMH